MPYKKKVQEIMIPVQDYPHIPEWFSLRQAVAIVRESAIKFAGVFEPRTVLVFNDKYQIVGILIAIAVFILLARESNEQDTNRRNIRRGFSLVAVCVVCGAIASISSKFAAMHTSKMAFIALSYFIGALFTFAFRNRLQTEERGALRADAVIIGVIMGVLNFVGFYAFLAALAIGPLSIIVSIMGLHFIIPIILSTIIYSEKLTPLRILGIVLTAVSVIFLKYGE